MDVEDRRKVLVDLTPRGEKVLADLSVSNLRELRLIAPALAGLLGQMEKLNED